MDLANPRLEDHTLATPLTPMTPSLSELGSLDTDSQNPLTPATMDILLEPVDIGPPGDERGEEDEDLFGRDDTIRLDPGSLARLQGRNRTPLEDEDDDLFPSTATPLPEPVEFDATRVPLPRSPSPAVDRIIPGPPLGWKSTLPSLARDDGPPAPPNNMTDAQALPDLGSAMPHRPDERKFTARTVSGSQPLKVKGRTVSGAMQYAMHRATESTLPAPHSTVKLLEPPPDNTGDNEATDAPLPPTVPLGLEEVSTVQQDEEIWMSYVRQQLAPLFPDFFDPNKHSQPINSPQSEIMVRAREQETTEMDHGNEQDVAEQSDAGPEAIGWDVIQDRGHRRPWTFNPRVPSVANVKDEIGGMRDEIERLREVVSGLANGMRGQDLEAEETEQYSLTVEQLNPGEDEEVQDVDIAPSIIPVSHSQFTHMS